MVPTEPRLWRRACVVLVTAVTAVAFVLLVAPPLAYAGASKTCAPGTAIPEARDQREGRDMAEDDDTAKAAGGKKRAPSKEHAEEIERWADELRAAARAGDLETMRRTFGALVGTVREAFPQPTWEERQKADAARWAAFYESEPDRDERRKLDRYLATVTGTIDTYTELETYEPEGAGVLAARIHDGQARVPWEPPHPDIAPDDFDAGRDLVRAVVEAFGTGDRETLDQLRPAHALLANLPTTEGARLARYVASVERALHEAHELELAARATFARHDALPNDTHADRMASRKIRAMTDFHKLMAKSLRHHDPAFARLDAERLRDVLLSVAVDPNPERNVLGRRKGGRGKKGAVAVAAALAVEVGAFGAKDVATFTKALTAARAKK